MTFKEMILFKKKGFVGLLEICECSHKYLVIKPVLCQQSFTELRG